MTRDLRQRIRRIALDNGFALLTVHPKNAQNAEHTQRCVKLLQTAITPGKRFHRFKTIWRKSQYLAILMHRFLEILSHLTIQLRKHNMELHIIRIQFARHLVRLCRSANIVQLLAPKLAKIHAQTRHEFDRNRFEMSQTLYHPLKIGLKTHIVLLRLKNRHDLFKNFHLLGTDVQHIVEQIHRSTQIAQLLLENPGHLENVFALLLAVVTPTDQRTQRIERTLPVLGAFRNHENATMRCRALQKLRQRILIHRKRLLFVLETIEIIITNAHKNGRTALRRTHRIQ